MGGVLTQHEGDRDELRGAVAVQNQLLKEAPLRLRQQKPEGGGQKWGTSATPYPPISPHKPPPNPISAPYVPYHCPISAPSALPDPQMAPCRPMSPHRPFQIPISPHIAPCRPTSPHRPPLTRRPLLASRHRFRTAGSDVRRRARGAAEDPLPGKEGRGGSDAISVRPRKCRASGAAARRHRNREPGRGGIGEAMGGRLWGDRGGCGA